MFLFLSLRLHLFAELNFRTGCTGKVRFEYYHRLERFLNAPNELYLTERIVFTVSFSENNVS